MLRGGVVAGAAATGCAGAWRGWLCGAGGRSLVVEISEVAFGQTKEKREKWEKEKEGEERNEESGKRKKKARGIGERRE